MTQAESVLSTPPTNTPIDTTRRRFLTQAAAVAAGGAALGAAIPLPVSAEAPERVPDPIYAAIDAHQAATAALNDEVARLSVFERELQVNGRLQKKSRLEDEVRQGDEIEAALDKAHDAETDAACALLNILPTTMAGAVALLRYADAFDTDGQAWPLELLSDDGSKTRSWHQILIAGLAEVLPELMPVTA